MRAVQGQAHTGQAVPPLCQGEWSYNDTIFFFYLVRRGYLFVLILKRILCFKRVAEAVTEKSLHTYSRLYPRLKSIRELSIKIAVEVRGSDLS